MRAWDYHKKVLAKKSGENKTLENNENSAFELLLTAIELELVKLSTLAHGNPRTARKKELIKIYAPAIDKYINSGDKFKNIALTQVMIWYFDVGDIENAMRLARVALEQRQSMPPRFKRDIYTAIADFVLDWVKLQNGKSIEPYFSEVFNQVFDWAIHDEIKIKYIKVLINQNLQLQNFSEALKLCDAAETLNPELAKVKTIKAQLMKKLHPKD